MLLSGYPVCLNVLMITGGDVVLWGVRVPRPALHAPVHVHGCM